MRALLTGLAVLLGVAMISGTYVFTDTINSTFDKVFEDANEGVDVVVSGRSEFDTDKGAVSQEIPESLVDRVKDVPGVLVAAGNVEDTASIFKANGDQIKTGGAPPLLFSRPPERFDPLNYVEGEPPANPQRGRDQQGDGGRRGPEDRRPGLARRTLRQARTSRSPAWPRSATSSRSEERRSSVVTLPEAQDARRPARAGRLDPGGGRAGVTPEELVTRIERVMPNTVEVKTGQQEADDEAESIQNSLSFLNILLLVFAGIAVFVGAFIIFNTFSITVAQRTKEFALLRTMGASRGQVLRSVMLEALIVGLIASILGHACWASSPRRASTRCSRPSGPTFRRRAWCSRAGPSSSACWSARSSRWSRASPRRDARHACRPWPRCARRPRRRRRRPAAARSCPGAC